MSFKRFVELGRVALIQFGPDEGKLCTIVDVVDHNRVLVDGPEPLTGVHRQAINLKRLMLTDIKLKAKLNASQKCAAPPLPPHRPASRVPSCTTRARLPARYASLRGLRARRRRSASVNAALAEHVPVCSWRWLVTAPLLALRLVVSTRGRPPLSAVAHASPYGRNGRPCFLSHPPTPQHSRTEAASHS